MSKRHVILLFSMLAITCALVACSVKEPKFGNSNGEAIEKALRTDIALNNKFLAQDRTKNKIPDAIKNALMPTVTLGSDEIIGTADTPKGDQQRFNVSVNNVPAKDFFSSLVKGTKYNMTVSPQVSGMISLDLKNVTIPEVMDTVREVYGFEYTASSYSYQVAPRQLATRIFNVNYLDLDRNGKSSTSFGSGDLSANPNNMPGSLTQQSTTSSVTGLTPQKVVSPSGTVETSTKSNFWSELKQNLSAVIGKDDGRSVVANPQSGVIIVRAYPDELRKVAEYLDDIQNNMNRQVIIEAQILEVQLSAAFQTGINWRLLGLRQGAKYGPNGTGTNPQITSAGDIANIPSDFASIFTMRASSGGTFESFVQLLNSQGRVNVLSSPRIVTTNNQKAVIKVGNTRFFVTDVTSNTTATTVGTTGTTQNIQLTPFFSGIALDVTPQINNRSEITLHIHPLVSETTLDLQKFTVNDQAQELPLAQSEVRESDSVVRASSGQIIVIGGLMQNKNANYDASTPGTEKLGPFSNLFKSTNKSGSKLELVILLRPIVVDPRYNWTKALRDEAAKFKTTQSDYRYQIVKGT
jgi:MSHA biogenesis protein MshL